MKIKPVCHSGSLKGRTAEFEQESVRLGRKPGNDMIFIDSVVSSVHAEMQCGNFRGALSRVFVFDQSRSIRAACNRFIYGDTRIVKKLDQLPNEPQARSFWNFYKNKWLPEETRDYVMSIVSTAMICEKREVFNFPMQPIN